MAELLLKYFTVYISSTLKFIFGPVLGTAYGYNVFTTGTLTILGMMTSVYVFTYFGSWIKSKISKEKPKKEKKVFSKKSRQYVKIWTKYGVPGIALLIPILLTPIGGTVLANAFGGHKKEIFKYMWLSCVFWSYSITWVVKFASGLIPIEDIPGLDFFLQ